MKKKVSRPVTVLQFGEGNFLRGFVDYMIDVANEKRSHVGNVRIVKCIPQGSLEALKKQDCVYTVILRGIRGGEIYVEKHIVTSVSDAVDAYEEYDDYAKTAASPDLQVIVSNTTEAGIVYDGTDELSMTPPKSFPGKLTKLLYERFKHFYGEEDKGLIILPAELIDKNGDKLLECCLKLAELWELSPSFIKWLKNNNIFCNTLVDRIVTGYPADEAEALKKELGYEDRLIVTAEPFALWVIESKRVSEVARRFPLYKANLPVIFTNDLSPYRERKVRILNGTHTSTALAAYLSGIDTVGDMMKDPTLRAFLEKVMFGELSPRVPLPADEVKSFADSVIERFANPFIKHNLLSISLNSVSKFKVRVLPTILETHEQTGALSDYLCFALAALVKFYSAGERGGIPYKVSDDAAVLDFFHENKDKPPHDLVIKFLNREDFWDRDLMEVPGFAEKVSESLVEINTRGMRGAVEWILSK
ncbi:MAG: tagaturonate reductase [Defluviitaleaceae bacterium]|nr:tagaturonate reductase [Defluviitaleaceae bacterium]